MTQDKQEEIEDTASDKAEEATVKTGETPSEAPETGPQEDAAQDTAEEASAKVSEDEEAEETEAQQNEADELRNQLLRVMADNENLRKRTDRDLSAAKKYGALGLARDLLSSVDNLETAISHIPEQKEDMDETLKNILVGVEMSGRELASVLERHGIQKITPDQEKFDYNLHQAMFEVPTDEVEPGRVVQVVQPGYMLHDRLLRPAMVGVSKALAQESASKTDT